MRRSICVCEPNHAYAGDTATWKFIYTTAAHLPKGTKLRFDLNSLGRPIDWQIPNTQFKEKQNLIWAECDSSDKSIPAIKVHSPEMPAAPSFEFVLPSELKSGEQFTIFIGAPNAAGGNTCQKIVQRKRSFHLYIDPKGKGDYKEHEIFHLDVRGHKLKTLRIIAPSIIARNKRFDVIVRFEDMFGNLTSNAPEGTLIELSYEHLRENLNWKLFVPETGFIALPSLYFNEPGVYKIQLKNVKTKEIFISAPIKCLPEGALNLFWGSFHCESERFDATENIEPWLRHMRDDQAMQFVATSCFDSEEETSNDTWKAISMQVSELNEDDRFVVLLGFQWLGETGVEGLRQFIYSKDTKPIFRKKDTKNNSLKKIYKTNNPKEVISIPSFTMGKTTCYNFEDFNPEFERVVEIYNSWGCSEGRCGDKPLRPISGSGKGSINETQEGSIIKALNKGCRFGFIAGGLDDRGPYSELFDANQVQYSPGLTAVLAKEQNRASIMEALTARLCYATTGERMIMGLQIASHPMGSELDTKTRPGLELNRYITGYAIGTQPIVEAVLIRCGKIFKELPIKEGKVEFELDDSEILSSIALERENDLPSFVYYYLRAIQADGHIAWSSPIWIDVTAKSNISLVKKTKKKMKDMDT